MYRRYSDGVGILRVADGAIIPVDPDNRDYRVFLEWLDAGNTLEE